jgi:DNA-binding LytR/AlgR family response regulator
MFKCIVVDDEPLALSLLENHIVEIPFLRHVGSFKNVMDASTFLSRNEIDVIFLDIQMPKLTGIDFLKSIKNSPKIILTTAYREYAVDSYEYGVLDYLLKPITFNRFFKAVNKLHSNPLEVEEQIESSMVESIFVYANKKQNKIILEEATHIEGLKDYVKIHLQERNFVVKETLSQILKRLPNSFLRVHRSYIVNIKKVTAYTAKDVELGHIEIPIGGSYKAFVINILSKNSS